MVTAVDKIIKRVRNKVYNLDKQKVMFYSIWVAICTEGFRWEIRKLQL